MTSRLKWPNGKSFAITIFDDTDLATLDNVSEVYALLENCGLRTTKSVWPSRGVREPIAGGVTCEDTDYVSWLRNLQNSQFEIGYHMNTFHGSTREETAAGLSRFAELFGQTPHTMANHAGCDENIYWGDSRLSGVNRLFYNLLTRFKNANRYSGHLEGDPHFWGDLCKSQIKYCRSFVYPDINTLKACPQMPYHDPKRPYVNHWFASSEGPTVVSFNELLSESNQDRLEEEGGACIVYTHFGCGFYEHKQLNDRFRILIERLGRKNGWFVPVATLLDYLLEVKGDCVLSARQRRQLERKWLLHKLTTGTS